MTAQNIISNIIGDKKRSAFLLLIILAGISLRLYCFNGYWGTDDGEYARLANAMAIGNFNNFVQENYIDNFYAPAHLPYRIGIIFPLSKLFSIFGISEWVLISYPLMISTLGILLAFLCGRLLFDVNSGLISAAIWAVLPLDVKFATSFLPDVPASFYASLGITVILFLTIYSHENKLFLFWGGLLAGLFLGISWLSKESVTYLVPFCGILIFISLRKSWKASMSLWLGVAIASAGILFTEMLVYYSFKGDLLLRMHENERSFIQTKSYLFYEGSRFGWPVGGSHLTALVKRLFISGPETIFLNGQFLFLTLFGLIASSHALYWKDKSFLFPAVWMLSLIFMYNFSSCSFSSYTPLVLSNSRYLHPIMLPATILTAGFLVKLFTSKETDGNIHISKEKFFWGIIIAVIIVSISSYYSFRMMRDMPGIKAIYEIKKASVLLTPSDLLYTDPLSIKAMEFYWKYPADMNYINFEGMDVKKIKPNSFVLIDQIRLDWLKINVSMWLTKDYGYHEPEFISNPPKSWKVVWQNKVATLFRVE